MANYYDEQISHMKHLMDYGMKSESKKSQYSSIMNMKEGADGRVYGIVAEGTKYYIKSCQKGRENLVEAFDYLGGFLNRKSCSYASYTDAVKDMDMRLMTLNEDYGKRMPINEMKRSADFMDESMVEMQEDIARHRQILENVDVIYQNKKGGIGDRNIGVPEAPKTQEFNTKVGEPFEDKASYEENRDNKETAKDHEKQGDPYEDEAKYEENTDNIQKKDSNTPGDTYTKKAEYVPDNAVAAMHPSGGHVSRVDESLGADYPEYDWENDPNGENLFPAGDRDLADEYLRQNNMEEGLDAEENHFPEENPDLGAAEHGELGDPIDGIDSDDLGDGIELPDDDLESDEFLAQFNDDPEEEIGEPIAPESDEKALETLGNDFGGEIAGIDDMSGVDRNNLSADVIDGVVNEIVNKFTKNKKMEMISESVAKSILREFDEKEKSGRQYYHDDDFMYGTQEKTPTPDSEFKSPSPLSQYMDKGSRRPNVGKSGVLDPRKGAPSYVNPDQVEYNPDSDYYLQNKYELGLNDDPEADYTESGAWKATDEKARKYATARVAKAQKELEMSGRKLNIDTAKVVDIFRHALYTLQEAKNNLAIIAGIHPEMIERFLNGNYIPYRNVVTRGDNGNPYGYRDAKDTPECIITPDGELPKGEDVEDEDQYVIGPSLKAMGFPDMSTEELRELVRDLMSWADQYDPLLEAEEEKMRGVIDYVQGLEQRQDAKYARTISNVSSEWTSLLEDIAGLMSFSAIPAEVLNKREEAANMSKVRRGKNIDGGFEEYDGSMLRNLHEDVTVLHDFGNHPGYRKKPMTTPANTEVAPNGARDWNDESAKDEEPFGKQIGSSAPYEDLVRKVTKEILDAIKGGLN